MPTDTLPPLADVPEQALTPADTAHAAGWAQTFGGSDTSLAQRYRHNADIQRHTKAVQDAQAAHVQDSLAHDKGAQDLYFRQKTLDATIDNREASLAQRQAQFEATLAAREKMDAITGELKIAQTAAAGQKAVASAAANKVRATLAAKEAADTDAAAAKLNEALTAGTIKPGTPGYADFVLGLAAQHPAMGKTFRGDLWKAANTNLSEDEFAAKKAQQTATLAGTVARTAVTEAHQLTTDEHLLQGYTGQRMRLKLDDKEYKHKADFLDGLINETKARIGAPKETAPVPTTPAAPERIATNPTTGEKMVFRNGQWTPE